MANVYNFFDTSSLLLLTEDDFKHAETPIAFSSVSLEELEKIKTSNSKTDELKEQARKIVKFISKYSDKVYLKIYRNNLLSLVEEFDLPINNDIKILACAIDYDRNEHPDEVVFVTNDLLLQAFANLYFGKDSITEVKVKEDGYTGYKIVSLSDEELSKFYENLSYNHFDLYINQYLIIKDLNGTTVDHRCWDGETHRDLRIRDFASNWFGKIKPKKGDDQQLLFADSLYNNQITMVRGPAGSGKTTLSLGYLMSKLEKHDIEKIIVFCNTVATKDSARLGFYPGTRDDKLLDSQIGNLLSSKLGDKYALQDLINKGQIVLLPMSDIRGYDTTGMKAGIYISEAQNLNVNLIKLALQRIGEDSICIIDGDDKAQVDSEEFAGEKSGMKRVSKVFRGSDVYGEVTLQQIHRSKIAKIAESL